MHSCIGRPFVAWLTLLATASCVTSALAASVNGIWYETKGKGPALVLIHGGQMDRRMWDAQFDAFSQHYRVIRYDVRGFGKSRELIKPFSYAEDLKSVLDQLHVQRASLLGLSLGAAIATDFTLAYPERVTALILACPGLGGFRFTNEASSLRPMIEAARDDDPKRAAELWLKNPFMAPAMEHPELTNKLRQIAYDNRHCWLNNPVLVRSLKPPAAQRLSEIRAPTLVIAGDRDVSDIAAIVEKLRKEIPNAKVEVLHGCGHIANMESPKEFNQLVLRFLANHSE